ncbi:MAG: ABC transporter permease subunit [Caldilineae bacterium]|nr:MAG: ABC transporter permease subunit [Caldilineae bacterium]
MQDLTHGFLHAFNLILSRDPALYEVIRFSLYVSGVALAYSTAIGIPLGALLGLKTFPGRGLVMALLYTGMGFPPVVVGLFVYLLLSRSGPLGELGWLFTPKAIIAAQTIISFPLVAGFTMAAVLGVDPNLRQQLLSLGATGRQATLAILAEARVGVVVSVIAGFGSVISEVGAVMLVGGNIEGKTRTLTTAVVLETRRDNFALAMALGVVLLLISFAINLAMVRLQGKGAGR